MKFFPTRALPIDPLRLRESTGTVEVAEAVDRRIPGFYPLKTLGDEFDTADIMARQALME
jgi:hypothetical protein